MNDCLKIGILVVEKQIRTNNLEINQLYDKVIKAKSRIEQLHQEKNKTDKDKYDIEEKIRNMNGKIGCPNCGQIYEKTKDLSFCPKCGCMLIDKSCIKKK